MTTIQPHKRHNKKRSKRYHNINNTQSNNNIINHQNILPDNGNIQQQQATTNEFTTNQDIISLVDYNDLVIDNSNNNNNNDNIDSIDDIHNLLDNEYADITNDKYQQQDINNNHSGVDNDDIIIISHNQHNDDDNIESYNSNNNNDNDIEIIDINDGNIDDVQSITTENEDTDSRLSDNNDNYDTNTTQQTSLLLLNNIKSQQQNIKLSTFDFNDDNRIIYNNDNNTYKLIMYNNEIITFIGCVTVYVITGEIQCNGYMINDQNHNNNDNSVDLYSYNTNNLYSIKCNIDNTIVVLLQCKNTQNIDYFICNMPTNDTIMSKINNFVPLLYNTYNIKKQAYQLNTVVFNDQYLHTVNKLLANSNNNNLTLQLLLCSSKNNIKSYYIQYIINQLLSKYKQICLLNTDITNSYQSICYGTLSLCLYNKPVFTYINNSYNVIQYEYYGSTSLLNNMTRYIQQYNKLYNIYKTTYNDIPLLIDTYEWIKGIGLYALQNMIDNSQLTNICFLQSNINEKLDLDRVNDINISILNSGSDDDNNNNNTQQQSINNQQYNTIQLTRYFRTCKTKQHISDNNTHISHILYYSMPYIVHMNSIAIIYYTSNKLYNQQYRYYVLNSSLVALYNNKQCIGFGIVKYIDQTSDILYVVSPVEQDIIKQCNTIVIGDVQLSASFYVDNISNCVNYIDIKQQNNLQYVSVNDYTIGSLYGGTRQTKRKFVQRKRLLNQ